VIELLFDSLEPTRSGVQAVAATIKNLQQHGSSRFAE
jgi:hypothetical protein